MEIIQINHDKVAHEEVGGEVLIIHLETGNYYSLSPTATLIWREVIAGIPTEQICTALAAAFSIPLQEVQVAVALFLDQLTEEGIVSRAAIETDSKETYALPPAEGPFEPPALTTYTNMSDLLLLDPIHDVDEAGWPQQKQE